jgi:protein-S-isoprenylcysteine O-methyltransferase Ste14
MPLFRKRILKSQLRAAFLYWVLIPAAVLGGGKGVDLLFGLRPWKANPILSGLAVAAIGGGCLLIDKSTRDLMSYGEGTPNPQEPPKRLVTEGSYAWCRHPMFFGYDLAAFGVILLFRSPGMLLAAFPVMLLCQWRFLLREEDILHRRFGAAFEGYRERVPFLLPRPPRKPHL